MGLKKSFLSVFGRYFWLELKRGWKVFLKSIGSLIGILILIVLGVSACNYVLQQTQSMKTVAVGVVIPKEESQAKMIAQYISSMDSVQSISDFCYLDYPTAMEKLQNGELQAVLTLPANFYEDIYVGENTPATIYWSADMPLNLGMFQELLLDGVSLVQISEAGVYASLDAARFQKTQVDQRDIGDFIVTMYIETILNRDDIFDKYMKSPLGEMSTNQYYVVALFTVFLLMAGVNFGFLYQSHGKAVEIKLHMHGIGAGKVAWIKILVMADVLFSVGMLLYLLLCMLSGFWSTLGVWFSWKTAMGLGILCLSISAFLHIVYTIAGNGFQGSVLLLAINFIMLLCSGSIVPAAYLPKAAAVAGEFLPLHFWQNYMRNILFDVSSIKDVLIACSFVAAGIGLGVWCEWKDM